MCRFRLCRPRLPGNCQEWSGEVRRSFGLFRPVPTAGLRSWVSRAGGERRCPAHDGAEAPPPPGTSASSRLGSPRRPCGPLWCRPLGGAIDRPAATGGRRRPRAGGTASGVPRLGCQPPSPYVFSPTSQAQGVSPLGLSPGPQVTSAPRAPRPPPFHLGACADSVSAPGPGGRELGRDLARMGAEPPALTDSLTARPGRSLRSRSGGREGGGAGFPAGGAEPALEKEKEKGGQGGSGSHRPECQGPSRASRTPAGGRER